MRTVVRFKENTEGRDFCVGDLHGMYQLLDKLLLAVKFDPESDRLFSVGDLVDRGPESHKALKYLAEPWFHAIRGNHEQMLIDNFENPKDKDLKRIWLRNGGRWWDKVKPSVQYAIYQKLSTLPYVIEIPTARGLVGLVHADITEGLDWPAFTKAVAAGHAPVLNHAIWSRTRAKNPQTDTYIEGIKDIYCGHTIVHAPQTCGNVHFIDTGAFLGSLGRLTLVEIGKGPEHRYSLTDSAT